MESIPCPGWKTFPSHPAAQTGCPGKGLHPGNENHGGQQQPEDFEHSGPPLESVTHTYCKDFALHEVPGLTGTAGIASATCLIHPGNLPPTQGITFFLARGNVPTKMFQTLPWKGRPFSFQVFAVWSSGLPGTDGAPKLEQDMDTTARAGGARGHFYRS